MVDMAGREQLFSLAESARRSAETFARAILDIEDPSWDDALRLAHKDRVDLYEICIRCLLDKGVSTAEIRSRLLVTEARGPADSRGAVQAVLAAELELEVAFRLALSQPELADGRIGETLGFYLLKSVAFRRQLIVLADASDAMERSVADARATLPIVKAPVRQPLALAS